jgi:hypothetical protein
MDCYWPGDYGSSPIPFQGSRVLRSSVLASNMTTRQATPLAWRLVRAPGFDDERYLIEFVYARPDGPVGDVTWRCDGVVRTPDDARRHAMRHGVSEGSFVEALAYARSSRMPNQQSLEQ